PWAPPRQAADGRARSRIRGARARARLFLRRYVPGRELRAFAEEELLHLLAQHGLRLRRHQVEPGLGDDHLRMLEPQPPGLHRHAVVDALAQLVVERLEGHGRQILAEFDAMNHPLAGPRRRAARRLLGCSGIIAARHILIIRGRVALWYPSRHAKIES